MAFPHQGHTAHGVPGCLTITHREVRRLLLALYPNQWRLRQGDPIHTGTTTRRSNPHGDYDKAIQSTRGLRQGDPISPALFVIAADYLSRALDKLILGHKEMTFKATRRCIEISHLAYADDIIIFTQAASDPLRRLRACLEDYAKVRDNKSTLSRVISTLRKPTSIGPLQSRWMAASRGEPSPSYTSGFPYTEA